MNIIHRDLKPENILIVNRHKNNYYPNVKICDFGMAKMVHKSQVENKLVGTIY
jgi:serine/threonine protein kinase